jgi:hypothetical protein
MFVARNDVYNTIIVHLIKSLQENTRKICHKDFFKKEADISMGVTRFQETETSHERHLVETLLKKMFVGYANKCSLKRYLWVLKSLQIHVNT